MTALRSCLRLVCLLALWWVAGSVHAVAEDPLAWITSIEGTVYLKMSDTQIERYDKLTRGRSIPIRTGWTVSTDKNTRCQIQLLNKSELRLGPYSSVRFTRKDRGVIARMVRGVMSFFHRDQPGEIEVESPQVAAVIYGTEFVFEVAENGPATLTLYDGRVVMTGGLEFTNGAVVVAEPGKAPHQTAVIGLNNLEAIQWCLYYPAVVDAGELGLDPTLTSLLTNSLRAYQAGDVLAALAAYPADRQPGTAPERVYYAALLLAVGNVKEAEVMLATVEGGSSAALVEALRQVIASVKLQVPRGVPLAGPTNGPASQWLALSYAQQSLGRLERALESAHEAVRRRPEFGFAWARVAELEFSFGHLAQTRSALDRALALAPRHAQAWALRGFVLCGQGRFREARTAFDQALEIDGALGNAWLGRGLCKIRQGDVAGGRADLETSASVEPQRALLRSYLGKAYFEERRPDQALDELRLARAKDPLDPTAWLYAALLKQNLNRVNEAIDDLEQSKRLNDNRYRYRSRLMLDQDQAVRGANLASLYREAGMTEVAVREAERAVTSDYANGSAHAFLANAYDALRDPRQINLRYETPWFSELLLANLLAPPGVGMLSQNVSQQEYSRLFDRNHVGLLSSTEYWSRGDWIQTASQYGQAGPVSYALDLDYRDEHGQRINEDRQATTFFGKTKIQLTPQDSLLVMANTLDYHAGDLGQYYNPARDVHRQLRVAEFQDPNLFLGYHREWQPESHTLLLLGHLDDTLRYDDPEAQTLFLRNYRGAIQPYVLPALDPNLGPLTNRPFHSQYQRHYEGYSAELQQIWKPVSHTIIAGLRVQGGGSQVESLFEPPLGQIYFDPHSPKQTIEGDFDRVSCYLYDQWQLCPSFQLQGGIAYDRVDYPANLDSVPVRSGQKSADQVSPKLGFIWECRTNTHLNGAWTRSLGGDYYDQSVRLEPTQWGGLNQAFRSLVPESSPDAASGLVPAARFETWGLSLDHRFASRTYVSLAGDWLRENAEREMGMFYYKAPDLATASTTLQQMNYKEKSLTTTVNQLLGNEWSIGLRHRVSLAELETRLPWLSDPFDHSVIPFKSLETDGHALMNELRLFTIWNHASGIFSRFDAHWHTQSNGGSYDYMTGDNFWQFDVFLGYRFWQRRATAQIGLLNLSGQDYHLNPLNLYQELPRARTFTIQFRLAL